MLEYLDLTKRSDLCFWGSLLVGFFAMLRKSNIMPDTWGGFNPEQHLTRGQVEFRGEIVILHATWTKMIQCRERVLEVPLFLIQDSPFCPVTILRLILAQKGKAHYPLFGHGKQVAFTYNTWQKKLWRTLKKAGYRHTAFSSHSMRHGGVNFAHRAGIPESLIQVHGDWASDCYKRYLTFPIEVRAVVCLKMRERLIKVGY